MSREKKIKMNSSELITRGKGTEKRGQGLEIGFVPYARGQGKYFHLWFEFVQVRGRVLILILR